VIGWGILRRSEPPRIGFVPAKRQTLVSTLPTNGKVEPFEWQAVRAESAGLVDRVEIREGDHVSQGTVLVTLKDPAAQTEIEAAEARVAEARAALAALETGGRPAELADIDSSLVRLRADLKEQTDEYNALRRLAQKQAATPHDVQTALARTQQTELEIQGLEKRRSSLIAKTDISAAQARLQDVQASLSLARQRAARAAVRAPMSGTVYNLAARPGGYLNIGDLIANVGRLDRLRVRVYVDEPELGRVAPGQPVAITWQALPGRKWEGTVERKPTSIQALGSRQVGEVVCTIGNPGQELIPGTNVDAEIRTAVVENALVIPRETLRRGPAGDFVLVLQGDVLEARTVKTGASSIALVQVTAGLAEGDEVAMPSAAPLKAGDRVRK
jgi:HlyD family secretion protein